MLFLCSWFSSDTVKISLRCHWCPHYTSPTTSTHSSSSCFYKHVSSGTSDVQVFDFLKWQLIPVFYHTAHMVWGVSVCTWKFNLFIFSRQLNFFFYIIENLKLRHFVGDITHFRWVKHFIIIYCNIVEYEIDTRLEIRDHQLFMTVETKFS